MKKKNENYFVNVFLLRLCQLGIAILWNLCIALFTLYDKFAIKWIYVNFCWFKFFSKLDLSGMIWEISEGKFLFVT